MAVAMFAVLTGLLGPTTADAFASSPPELNDQRHISSTEDATPRHPSPSVADEMEGSGSPSEANPACKADTARRCDRDAGQTRDRQACPINAYALTTAGMPIADGASGSLRWAVEVANATACDVVKVHPGTHVVSLEPRIDVTDDLEMIGVPLADGQRPVVERKGPFGILSTIADLTITEMIFSGGTADVGAIVKADCACTVTINESVLRDAHVTNAGGAIWATTNSSLALHSTEVRDNTSLGQGAAIATAGELRLVDSTFEANEWVGTGTWSYTTPIDAGSGSAPVSILRSHFERNRSQVGGVIAIGGGRSALIHESRFVANFSALDILTTGTSAGIVTVTSGADLRMSDVEFSDNITSVGPLLVTSGTADVERLSSHNNVNRVDIWIWSGTDVSIRNSTIVDTSPSAPGLTPNAAIVQALVGDFELEHVTVRSENRPALHLPVTIGAINLHANYIEGPVACDIGNLQSAVVSSRFNYFTDESCQVPGEVGVQVGAPLPFGPLVPHTGFGASMSPANDSPLIDAIPIAECSSPEDQRRRFRPNGDGCDIGAVEWYFSEGPIGIGGPG